jgi:hypothetical protein
MLTIDLLECGHPESEHSDFTRGYGRDKDGSRFCYACCADRDRQQMKEDGRTCLYLAKDDKGWKVTNWPGSLVFRPSYVKKGSHNIAGTRLDAWFAFEGHVWHAVQYGEWTQIAHCRRTKEQVS